MFHKSYFLHCFYASVGRGILANLGIILGHLSACWGYLGGILPLCRGILGLSWAILGTSKGYLFSSQAFQSGGLIGIAARDREGPVLLTVCPPTSSWYICGLLGSSWEHLTIMSCYLGATLAFLGDILKLSFPIPGLPVWLANKDRKGPVL